MPERPELSLSGGNATRPAAFRPGLAGAAGGTQAYACGVSTRKVDQLVESLGLRVSRSEVSRICASLDEQVGFRSRPLEDEADAEGVRLRAWRGRAAVAGGVAGGL